LNFISPHQSLPLFLNSDDGLGNTALCENSTDLAKKVPKQSISIYERVWSSRIGLGAVPVIARPRAALESRTTPGDPMSIVEANKAFSMGTMQRKRIRYAVWPMLRRLHAFNLEFDPIALFEIMDSPMKGEQELKRVIDLAGHIIS